jgi:hypothetical protein
VCAVIWKSFASLQIIDEQPSLSLKICISGFHPVFQDIEEEKRIMRWRFLKGAKKDFVT